MSLQNTIKQMKDLLEQISADLAKAEHSNKAASQRVRTGTIRLEKIAKNYRKESVKHEKSPGFKKTAKKSAKKPASKAKTLAGAAKKPAKKAVKKAMPKTVKKTQARPAKKAAAQAAGKTAKKPVKKAAHQRPKKTAARSSAMSLKRRTATKKSASRKHTR